MEVKYPIAAIKVQKATREKLRDILNEQFLELGNTLGPNRPKNDKATILADTIQMLKDLTAEVNRLKAENSALNEESCELTQEKNELREEKSSLKADIENLTVQYQQGCMVMFPWTGMDPSGVMAPPYPYPVPLPVATGPIAIHHPSLQPYPFLGNHSHGVIANPCSTFMPYSTSSSPVEQPSSQRTYSSHTSSERNFESKSVDYKRGSNRDRCDGSNNFVTELELQILGSSTKQALSAGKKKGKEA
ncbi:transcription factor bHLH121-like [Hibiscus syriacus]|uniref:transcription factor bHLH121-like n=1 Tax=Hibiscus syriacus TaxID=106335 RepID=UPI001921627B|nr:transcription factor bHLH121-like [Hibiscus syriacus]